jgi:hypothetical protein
MRNKLKTFLLGGTIIVGIASMSTGVYAASRAVTGYGRFEVPVIGDKHGDSLTKVNNSRGANRVDYIQRGELVSWIETTVTGTNVTNKVTYSTTGRYLMTYKDAQANINKKLRLNISTAPSYWNTVITEGSWSPDEY